MSQQLPKHLNQIVESLNGEQLHELYQLVVERLNLVHKVQALHAMRNFHVLDRVSFTHNEKKYTGMITRLNQRTVSVVLDDGGRWNVTPGSLKKINQENPLQEIFTPEQWEKMRGKK